MTAALVAIVAIWLALAIDHLRGEPSARWHPVVWMGRYLAAVGRRIAPQESQASRLAPFVGGALAWCLGALVVFIAGMLLHVLANQLPAWLAALLLGLALKPLLAWRMLREETAAADAALDESLDAGRLRLSRLVSRDVDALDATAVRESAIESLAENLNDSVVAPLFWFVVLGLPGAVLYRFANTADAMWGYPGERGGRDWSWAGKWAARADDALSWLPARLTALLLAAAAVRWPRGLAREARRTPSPNSGWPMAAMALLLGVRLGKPGVYVLHANGRAVRPGDMAQALSWSGSAVLLAAALGSLVLLAAA